MDPRDASASHAQVEAFGRRHRTGLVTLVFTDMVGSTALKQQLGDRPGAQLIEQHHALVRSTLTEFPDGEELSTAGDSFFLVFATPSAGVKFALILQQRLRELSRQAPLPVRDRVGVHLGEVLIQEADQQRTKDLIGLNVDLGARVMGLAQGGQILLTRAVFDSARQALKGEDISGVGQLSWLNHGLYQLKGIEEAVEICEVGEVGVGLLRSPATTEKGRRVEAPEGEAVLGWRPAVGQVVPNTQWVLEQKLGEGGFGEVWLGRHQKLKERRVFKFCFRADRVRSLKREMTLFRVLKERVGDHPNIVRLLEVYFEEPPFYVVMDHVEGSDLKTWCEEQGGVEKVPLASRLEIVAQIADALQAAHDAGVIHRDVKPGNILVSQLSTLNAQPTAKLTDFGIGQVVSEEALKGVTKAGFTQTIVADSSSSQTGSQMYMAPELLAGKPASIRSDIYSLGVVLYQLLVGDFTRPVTAEWSEEITDPLLREDLKHCLAGKPDDRFTGAGQLARSLRALPERRTELERRTAEKAALERAAYQRGIVRAASLATGVVLVVCALALVALTQSRRAKAETAKALQAAAAEKRERTAAQENLYVADINLAYQAFYENNLGLALDLLNKHRPASQDPDLRGWEWRYLWGLCRSEALYTLGEHSNGVFGVAISPDDKLLATVASLGDGEVRIWDLDSRRLLEVPQTNDARMSVAFSPDGKMLAFGTGNQGVKLWDVREHREIARFVGEGAGFGSPALGFSPGGRQLAIGEADGSVVLWDLATRKAGLTLKGHSAGISSLAFSPDGQMLATGSGDRTVRVWSLTNGQEVATFTNHTARVQCVALSPDGRILASGSWDNTIRIWDLAQRRQVTVLTNHTGWIAALAFSPDGSALASASADGLIKFWDPRDWREVSTLRGSPDEVFGIAFSSDGEGLFSGTKGGKILAWDGRPHAPRAQVVRRPNDAAELWLHSPGWVPTCWRSNETFNLWDPLSLRKSREHPAPERELWTSIAAVPRYVRFYGLSPGGERLAFATRQGSVCLWDIELEHEITRLPGCPATNSVLEFSPDGKLLVAIASGKGLKLWNLETHEEFATLPKSAAWPHSVCFSAKNAALAVGNFGGTVEVWDLVRRERVADWKAHNEDVAVAFMPDCRSLVTVSYDTTAKLWELETQREVRRFGRALNAFSCVGVSLDGQRIAAGIWNGRIKIWNSTTGQEVATLQGVTDWVPPNLPGGSALVRSVAFLPPDGNTLIAATQYQVRLWRAPSWAEIEAAEKSQANSP